MKSTPIPFTKVPTLQELISGFPSVTALFFDMDGTLFNTESIHADAMMMIAKKYQITPPHPPEVVHDLMMGKADHLVFDMIKNWEGVPTNWIAQDFIAEKNVNVIELLQRTPVATYSSPSVSELISEAKASGFYLALVTSSEKAVTDELLRLTGLDEFFHFVLTRDDTPHVKPDPWPYLKAKEVSQKEVHEIVIFEDSHVGLEAATKSGAHVIKVEWY
jgi:HAD superfamily hydrolase (TIGR01509 family)